MWEFGAVGGNGRGGLGAFTGMDMGFTQTRLEDLAKRYTDAWNSKVPERVAEFHTDASSIVINRGEPSVGPKSITEVAVAFHTDVPDLSLVCDGVRGAGSHVVYMWTFTGHHAETGNVLNVHGWEEWELDLSLIHI